jgi:hypothetical protein
MKKLLLIAFLFMYSFINAQISFEKGYFISNNGTRTQCFIKNLDWSNNPTDFRYKININDTEYKTETAATIREFGIENGSTYEKAKVKIDQSNNSLERITTSKNPIWQEDTIFLKVLVTGDATLYYYVNENFARFFYKTKSQPIEQLVYKEYLALNENNGTKTILENNYYKQQLLINVKSENITDSEIKRLTYKKDPLMKYFLKYNNINADEIKKTLNSTNKTIYHLKITPGISLASLLINSAESSGFKNAQYDTKVIFKFGIEGELVLPINKNKWSLFINPSYQKYSDSQEYGVVTGVNDGLEFNYPSEVEYSSFQLPIGVRHYFFLNDKSKIFIDGAYVVDINGRFTLTSKPINLNSNTGGNFALGLGYNFKNKISFEIRYNANKNTLNTYNSFAGEYKTTDFIFGYSFF